MPQIIGVKFKGIGKAYYFDPKDIEFTEKDGVIVETVRGQEYGVVTIPNMMVPDEEIKQPLKEVVRKATEKDLRQYEANEEKRPSTLKSAIALVEKHNLNMKMVDCDYTFDNKKLTLYFTADGRVDFRELVRDLASQFRTRIELRQIYERDDIKLRGALASCGRPCCCTQFLCDFEKVSLKMAKIQGLSLNPSKISGVCGKLMCCLKYENETYQDAQKRMPTLKQTVTTPDGKGEVIGVDLLRERCKVRIEKDNDTIINDYNLKDMSFCKKSCKGAKCDEISIEPDYVKEEEIGVDADELKNLED